MTRKMGAVLLLSFCMVMMLFSGCTGAGSSVSNQETSDSKYGGKIVVSNINEPHCLDPRKDLGTYGAIVANQVFEHLIGTDPVTGSAVPGLATSWEHSEDGLTYTFNLREGVKWQDGTDFTADDVVYTFGFLTGKTENPGSYASLFKLLESCNKVDDYTVTFSFSQPWDSFEKLMQSHYCTCIVSHIDCEKYTFEDYGMDEKVVGTGPFKVQYYTLGEPVILVRNDNYWQEGLPYLDEIEFRYISDATVRAINAVTGEVDVTNEPATDSLESILSYSGMNLQNVPGNGVISIQFNSDVDTKPFGDTRVRQAIAYAIDREAICEAVYGENGMVAYDDFPAWHEAYDPDYKNYTYDPDLAKQLLAEAGYDENNRLAFTHMTTTNTVLIDMLTIMQAQLAEVNVDMEIKPLESGVRNAIIAGKDGYSRSDFHCITTLQALPSGTTDDYIAKYFLPGGATNKFNYNMEGGCQNEQVVELINEARSCLDVEKRIALYREAVALIDQDCVRIPLLYVNNMAIVNDRVQDFTLLNTPVVSYAQVWVTTK